MAGGLWRGLPDAANSLRIQVACVQGAHKLKMCQMIFDLQVMDVISEDRSSSSFTGDCSSHTAEGSDNSPLEMKASQLMEVMECNNYAAVESPLSWSKPDELLVSQCQRPWESTFAIDPAMELQMMAAEVLQRKQGRHMTSGATAAGTSDHLQLLRAPEQSLKARKDKLRSASDSNAGEGSARVAAVQDQLAGVQARLKNALGLMHSAEAQVWCPGRSLKAPVFTGTTLKQHLTGLVMPESP